MKPKFALIILLTLAFSAMGTPDVSQLLEESKSAASFGGYFSAILERNSTQISNGLTTGSIYATYRRFINKCYSFDISPRIGFGVFEKDDVFLSLDLGLGITRYFIKNARGPYLSFSLANNNYLLGEYSFDRSSIEAQFHPGYMVEIKDNYYLNTGLLINSEYDFRGYIRSKFNEIYILYSFGITRYF
jgi:hypothetical protein